MIRHSLLLAWLCCIWACGCNNEPGSVQTAAQDRPEKARETVPDEVPPQSEPPLEDEPQPDSAVASKELKLAESGITFVVPEGWKQVKPEYNIIEAEFELPRAEGDEYDGRLTLMSSLGNREDLIARRTSEFNPEPGESPTRETLSVGGIEATVIDLRGEWKGPDFRPINPLREGYRMLYVVVPFGENSSFYAKLTGPRATIAEHELEFREFLKSAKISR